MAYAVYTTRAIVCGSKDSYTSDRSYLLFTEAAGMVWARARSVRVEKSKQRYALQDFSTLRVSLVKGKTGWKIGSAEALGNPFLAARERSSRALTTYVIRQLRRYMHGEEPARIIFLDVWELLQGSVGHTTSIESVFTLRLLHQLGYVSSSPALRELITAPSTSEALSYYAPEQSGEIDRLINQAETASHL